MHKSSKRRAEAPSDCRAPWSYPNVHAARVVPRPLPWFPEERRGAQGPAMCGKLSAAAGPRWLHRGITPGRNAGDARPE
jgi:hypothetical protein